MPHFSSTLTDQVRTHHGVVTLSEMANDGLSTSSVRNLVTQKAITQCHQGVYRVTTSPDTLLARCAAACLADPSAVISGLAGGWIWEFRHIPRVAEPIVLVEHDRRPLSRSVLIRRTNVLEPEDWVLRSDGVRLASPTRAWFDCARDLKDEKFEMLTEWVIDRHASPVALWRMRRRMQQRGRPGLARVNRVLSQRSMWQRPEGSGLEHRVLAALESRGVQGLIRQHSIRLQNGSVIHPDGALPHIRWAIEVDHVTWHGGRIDAQRDKGRDRRLRRIGWQVDRVTDVELTEQFDTTIDEVLELISLRTSTNA